MDARTDKLTHLMLSRLKLRHFSILDAIDKHRTISRSAAALQVTQPAMTRSLREIEDIFMTRLFERSSVGLKATPSGETALRYARLMLTHAEATSRKLSNINDGRIGSLRIGITPHIPELLLTSTLTHLLGSRPRISVAVREATTDELVAALHARELDCVIGRSYNGVLEDEFVQEPIYFQKPCLLVARRSHTRLSRGPLDWKQLADLDWIMQPPTTPMRRSIEAIFTSAGVRPPLPFVETYSLKSMGAVFATEPNAITIIAQDTAVPLVTSGVCAMLPYPLHWDLPPVSLFAPNDLAQHAVLQSLMAVIRSAALQLKLPAHSA